MELLDELRRKKTGCLINKKQIQFNEDKIREENFLDEKKFVKKSNRRVSQVGKETAVAGAILPNKNRKSIALTSSSPRNSINSFSTIDFTNTSRLIELLEKYSHWKNIWMNQLNNVSNT